MTAALRSSVRFSWLVRPFGLVLCTGAIACGSGTSSSHSAVNSPVTPTVPSAPTTRTQLQIVAVPATLQIGLAAQVRAIARYEDGTYVDASAQAFWSSSRPDVCKIAEDEIVSAVGAGTAVLQARFGDLSASASLSCGYFIEASVHENAPTENVVVPGAQIVAVGGPLDGRTFLTDAQGHVTLPPVAAPGFRLQFKKTGYDDLDYIIRQLPRETALDIGMMPVPSVHVDYSPGLGCTTQNDFVEDGFSSHREGHLYAEVRGSNNLLTVSSGGKVWLEASTEALDVRPRGDVIIPAGDYHVYVQFDNPCSSTAAASIDHLP
ncbi:MAG: hypothetical protein ACM3SQ_11475 [Betaproteobacteria bacterium]